MKPSSTIDEHGRAALVVRGADDGEEDLGRQHLEIAAEHERIAEIGQALDEAEQEGVGEPRPHQRQRDGAERRPALGAQGLRRLLERRADALHDADQHQEGDRREGEQLRDEDAGQAVDPARARNAEPVRQQRRDGARAAEQQDQREADDEGRRDDRQHASGSRSAPLKRKPVRVAMSAKARPSAVVPTPTRTREEQRVPGDAAAQVRRRGSRGPRSSGRRTWPTNSPGAKLPRVVLDGARQDRRDREEHEDARSARRRCRSRTTTKASPRHQPRAASPWQSSIRKASRGERRAEAHAGLARPRRAEQRGEPGRRSSRAGRWRSPAATSQARPSTPASTSQRAARRSRPPARPQRRGRAASEQRQKPPRAASQHEPGR